MARFGLFLLRLCVLIEQWGRGLDATLHDEVAGLPGLRFAAWEVPCNPGAREVVGSNPTDPTKLSRALRGFLYEKTSDGSRSTSQSGSTHHPVKGLAGVLNSPNSEVGSRAQTRFHDE